MKRTGLTLFEENFCRLVAIGGKTDAECASEAFGIALVSDRARKKAENKAGHLKRRPDIAARIAEAKGEEKRRNRELWAARGEDLADRIFRRVMEADMSGGLLTRDALKGVEVLAKLKGLNAPDETVLKDGGRAEDFTPRGLEQVSDADLEALIRQGDAIEAETVEPGAEGVE